MPVNSTEIGGIICAEIVRRLKCLQKSHIFIDCGKEPTITFRRAYSKAKGIRPESSGQYISIYHDNAAYSSWHSIATIGILAAPDYITIVNHCVEQKICHEVSIHDTNLFDKVIATIALIV